MHANQLYKCRGKKKKIIFIVFYNIIPTLTLPLTLRSLYSFSDVEHIRSGQWSYLPLPAPAVFSGRKAQYLRREFFFSPLRPEHFYQVKSWISSFATRIFCHQNISGFATRITFFSNTIKIFDFVGWTNNFGQNSKINFLE